MTTTTKYLLAIFCILCGCLLYQASFAATNRTLTAEWTYNTVDEALINGYKLYNKSKVSVKEVLVPTARTTSWVASFNPGACESFYISAIGKDGKEYTDNKLVEVCAPYLPAPAPMNLKITLKE